MGTTASEGKGHIVGYDVVAASQELVGDEYFSKYRVVVLDSRTLCRFGWTM